MWVFAKTSGTLIFFNKWKKIGICFIAGFHPIQQIEHLILNFLLSYTNGSWGCWLKTSFFATFSIEIKTRSAARIETAGDSEELLARVVGPTSSSYFLPVAGEVTTQIKCI